MRSGAGELYDLYDDPHEMHNMFDDPATPSKTALADMIRSRPADAIAAPSSGRHGMKITNVRAHVLRSELQQPFAFSQGWVSSRGATLVEIRDRRGRYRLGRGAVPGAAAARDRRRRDRARLEASSRRKDPLQPEVLWHRMYHHTRDYGQKGARHRRDQRRRHRALGHRRQGAARAGGEASRRRVPHARRGLRHRVLSHQGSGRSFASHAASSRRMPPTASAP